MIPCLRLTVSEADDYSADPEMKRLLFVLLAPALMAASSFAAPQPQTVLLPKANPLPLALDDAIQFRKTSIFVSDPKSDKPTLNDMLNYQRQAVNFGAITNFDRASRYGYYYNFYWRAKRPANLVLRFEYRQQELGSYVQAKEIAYDNPKGTIESKFSVIGDDYNLHGRVTAWRALLIENGKIVALNQSFLWD